MRVLRSLLVSFVAVGAVLVLAPAASAAPEPCVTIYDPTNPGYAGPTCPVSVVRGLLP